MEPYFSNCIDREDLIPRGSRILAALSGGRDSVCLLHKLVQLAPQRGWTVFAAHLDHGIREASARDARFAAQVCGQLGVICRVARADVPALRQREKLSLEDAARRARYRFLEQTAQEWNCDVIALAHHAGDQAETMLLHLLRGSGLAGAAGMQPRRGRYVRPMLFVPSDEVQAYAQAHGLAYVEDETNRDRSNPRNALRHEVLPALERIAPQAQTAFARAACSLREDEEALTALARDMIQDVVDEAGGVSAGIRPQPHAALTHRAVLWLCSRAGLQQDMTRERVLAAAALLQKGAGQCQLPHGYEAMAYRGRFWVGRRQQLSGRTEARSGARLGPWHLVRTRLEHAPDAYTSREPWEHWFAAGALEGELCLRGPAQGDRVFLSGGSKPLGRYLSDAHVPPWLRGALPLAAIGDRVIWIPCTGYADPQSYVQDPAQPVEYLQIRKEEEHV